MYDRSMKFDNTQFLRFPFFLLIVIFTLVPSLVPYVSKKLYKTGIFSFISKLRSNLLTSKIINMCSFRLAIQAKTNQHYSVINLVAESFEREYPIRLLSVNRQSNGLSFNVDKIIRVASVCCACL